MFFNVITRGINLMVVINAPVNDFSDIKHAVMPFNILADHYGAQLAATQLQLEHEAHTEGEKRFLKAMERQIKLVSLLITQ